MRAAVLRPPPLNGKSSSVQQPPAAAVTASSAAGLASPGLMARQLSAAASTAASPAPGSSGTAASRGDTPLELSEEALWSDHEDSQGGAGGTSDEETDDDGEGIQRPASSGSSHEAALDSELKSSADKHVDTATAGLHVNGTLRTALSSPPPNLRRATATGIAGRRMHSSGYPDDDASILATSVPIAIPLSLRETKLEEPDSPLQTGGFSIKAATFVPPHMLEASRSGAIDIVNSVQGTSPSASLKRERLVNRNAILRRTGFIESSQGAAFLETMDPIRETAFEPSEAARASLSSSPASFSQPGALTKALEKAGIGSL